jgi:hypothetical protein
MNPEETSLQEALAKFKRPFEYDDFCISDSETEQVFDIVSGELDSSELRAIGTAIADFLNRASQPEKRDVYSCDYIHAEVLKNGVFFARVGEPVAAMKITDELHRLAGVHRSEFICDRCLLRQDDTFPKNHDF